MKKIFLFSILIFETFFGFGLKAQTSGDELGIKNEKDFVNFIKSIAIDENKSEENKYSVSFYKIIRNSSNIITIRFTIDKDLETGYKLDSYQGEIKFIDAAVFAKYKNYDNGFTKSRFKFLTYEDLIMGEIIYYTGPGPYRSGSNILQQYVDPKKTQSLENAKSIPSVYISEYIFEIKKESDQKNIFTEISENTRRLKEEIELKKKDLTLKINEIESKNKKIVNKEEQKEEEEENEEYDLNDEKITPERKIKIIEYQLSQKVKELERLLSDSIDLQKKYEKEHFLVVKDGFPSVDEKFTIVSKPKLLSKSFFWEDNGNRGKWNVGYEIKYNPKNSNDTLSYKFWNPKRNGKIYEYKILNGRKVQMSSGEYKNGLPIGEIIEYSIERNDTRVISTVEIFTNEGKRTSFINYRTESIYLNNNNDSIINYKSRIFNYDPITGKQNGLYEEYILLKDKDGNTTPKIIISKTGNYLQDKQIGEWKEFFENGKLKQKINFATGESELYDENGELLNKTFKKIQ
jgi:hypothetical protein